jgi:hypothetical protein
MKRPRPPPRGLPLARKENAKSMLAKRHRLQKPCLCGAFAATLLFKKINVGCRCRPAHRFAAETFTSADRSAASARAIRGRTNKLRI